MAFGASTKNAQTRTLMPSSGAVVLSADRARLLQPGDEEMGWTARIGRIPLGYLDDREGTEQTFPIIDGQRVSVPGDRARLADDGTIIMLGRDSMVVNTGGEKVFVEEVEEVLRAHPAVADALVVGRPSERWGQELVALVAMRDGNDIGHEPLHALCTSQLARFKTPKQFIFVEQVRRLGNGKADYRWAKAVAIQKDPV